MLGGNGQHLLNDKTFIYDDTVFMGEKERVGLGSE